MPKVDTEGHILLNEPITEDTVRANIEALLAPLRASPQDCWVYQSAVTALKRHDGTPFANLAGEYVRGANQLHREGMGEVWDHLPGCPLR